MLLLGLLLTGGVYAAFAPAQDDEAQPDVALVEEGRKLFLVGCAFCHGQNGEGQNAVGGEVLGPPLIGVGAAAVDFQVGTGRMPQTQLGAQNPTKPETYDEPEIEALAAYVASLGPGPAIPNPEDYSLAGLSEEEREEAVARGGQIFLTNCTACHNFAGAGGPLPWGRYAPALDDVHPRFVYEAMLTGPQQMPVFSDEVMTPKDKRAIIAYIHSLQEWKAFGGAPGGSLGPVAEGLIAWVLGMGILVLATVWIAAKGVHVKGTPNA